MNGLVRTMGAAKRGLIGMVHNALEPTDTAPTTDNVITIGSSVQHRPILCERCGSGNTHVALVCGTHGNEVGTIKLGYRLASWLRQEAEQFPGIQFSIIPCLNPDGYAHALAHPNYWGGGRVGRCNGNNVDLNRNFDTPSFQSEANWNYGKNYREKRPIFAGKHGGSEPEIRALTSYMLDQKVTVFFAFHSVGQDVMGNTVPLSTELVAAYASSSGFKIQPPKHWQQLEQSGVPGEWCEQHNIAYVEVETPHRWSADWPRQKRAITGTLRALVTKNH